MVQNSSNLLTLSNAVKMFVFVLALCREGCGECGDLHGGMALFGGFSPAGSVCSGEADGVYSCHWAREYDSMLKVLKAPRPFDRHFDTYSKSNKNYGEPPRITSLTLPKMLRSTPGIVV